MLFNTMLNEQHHAKLTTRKEAIKAGPTQQSRCYEGNGTIHWRSEAGGYRPVDERNHVETIGKSNFLRNALVLSILVVLIVPGISMFDSHPTNVSTSQEPKLAVLTSATHAGNAQSLSSPHLRLTIGIKASPSTIQGVKVSVGSQPKGLLFDPQNNLLYVANYGSQNVSVVNTTTDTVIANIPVGHDAWEFAYDPTNNLIYLANDASNVVSIIDPRTNHLVGNISTGSYESPSDVTYDPYNGDLLVDEDISSDLLVIDPSNNSILRAIPTIGYGNGGVAIDPTSHYVYLAVRSDDAVVGLDVQNGTVMTSTPFIQAPGGDVLDTSNNLLYVSVGGFGSPGYNQVSYFYPGSTRVLGNMTVGNHPSDIINPCTGVIAVDNYYSGVVNIINDTTNRVVDNLTILGPGAGGLTFDPLDSTLYVAVTNSSIIQGFPVCLSTSSGPTITSFTASPKSIALGQTTYFNTTVSGGSPPYSYAYSGLPSGCTTDNTSSLACTPGLSGKYSPQVYVNDSAGKTATSVTTLNVTACTAYGYPQVTPTNTTLTFGSSQHFNVTASGCSPVAGYSWSLSRPLGTLNTTTGTSATFTADKLAGSLALFVNVTYVDGGPTLQSSPILITITNLAPVISSFNATPDQVEAGYATYLNVTASGGMGPLSYVYTGLPGCSTSDTPSLKCIPTLAGRFTVRVNVSDSAGHSATAETNLTVIECTGRCVGLFISSFVADPSTIILGGTAYLNVSAMEGAAPYTYSYTGLPPGCASANTSVLACTPTRVGTFIVTAVVADMADHQANASLTLKVVSPTSKPQGLLGLTQTQLTILIGGLVAVATVTIAMVVYRRRSAPASVAGAEGGTGKLSPLNQYRKPPREPPVSRTGSANEASKDSGNLPNDLV